MRIVQDIENIEQARKTRLFLQCLFTILLLKGNFLILISLRDIGINVKHNETVFLGFIRISHFISP